MSYIITFFICLIAFFNYANAAKRALLVGISNYPVYQKYNNASWHIIHGTNDMEIITPVLTKQGFKIKKLQNKQATANNIRNSLKQLCKSTKKGDVIYIHFSCHGQPVEDLNGDESDGWDESIVPYDAMRAFIPDVYEGKNHILDDELNKYISTLREKAGKSGFVWVVLDACHTGSASRSEDFDDEAPCRGTKDGFSKTNKTYRPPIDESSNFVLNSSSNLSHAFILEACRSYQSNHEIKVNGNFYGPLSYCVVEVLRHINLETNVSWVEKVRKLMLQKAQKQDMVIEKSFK